MFGVGLQRWEKMEMIQQKFALYIALTNLNRDFPPEIFGSEIFFLVASLSVIVT
jgi:hypothetical protein